MLSPLSRCLVNCLPVSYHLPLLPVAHLALLCPGCYLQLVGPLVHERDLYLAWSLKRSKAVNGACAVVGVIGKGHLRGVCYALTHDEGMWAAGEVAACSSCGQRVHRRGETLAHAADPTSSQRLPRGPHYLRAPACPLFVPLLLPVLHPAAGANLRFQDLVGGKNVKANRRRQRAAAVGRFALDTALFGVVWYAWTALQP